MTEQEKIEVRVIDLYELVRYYYATASMYSNTGTTEAADRCQVALCGVPRIDLILKDHDMKQQKER